MTTLSTYNSRPMRFEKVSFDQFERTMLDKLDDMPYMRYKKDEVSFHMKLIYDGIKLPERSTAKSAGYDFFLPFGIDLPAQCFITIPTGIRVILDDDKFLAIYPRSGLGFKHKLQLANSVGIVDADYVYADNEGHILVKLYNDYPNSNVVDAYKHTISLDAGKAFCQGIIQQYFKVADDTADGVRIGGFGSTGI